MPPSVRGECLRRVWIAIEVVSGSPRPRALQPSAADLHAVHDLDLDHHGRLRCHQGDPADDADAFPPELDERGGVRFLVDHETLDRLTALRGPGESYSDVILRMAKAKLIVRRSRPPVDLGMNLTAIRIERPNCDGVRRPINLDHKRRDGSATGRQRLSMGRRPYVVQVIQHAANRTPLATEGAPYMAFRVFIFVPPRLLHGTDDRPLWEGDTKEALEIDYQVWNANKRQVIFLRTTLQ